MRFLLLGIVSVRGKLHQQKIPGSEILILIFSSTLLGSNITKPKSETCRLKGLYGGRIKSRKATLKIADKKAIEKLDTRFDSFIL